MCEAYFEKKSLDYYFLIKVDVNTIKLKRFSLLHWIQISKLTTVDHARSF